MTGYARKAVGGAAWTGAALGVSVLAQLVLVAILARVLPADQVALATMLLIGGQLLELLVDGGVSAAFVREQQPSRVDQIQLFWFNLLVGAVLSMFLLGAGLVLVSSEAPASVGVSLLALCLSPCGSALGQQSRAALEKALRFRSVSGADVAYAMTLAIVASLVSSITGQAYAVSVAIVLAVVVRSVFMLAAARDVFRPHYTRSLRRVGHYLSFGLFQTVDSLLNFAQANLVSIIVAGALPSRSLAGYNLATNVAVNFPGRLNPVITRVGFAISSRFSQEADRFSLAYVRIFGTVACLNLFILGCLVVTAGPVVHVLYGESWDWIVPLVQLLSLAGVIRALVNPTSIVTMALDRVRLGFIANVIKFVIIVPMTLGLVWSLGLVGAVLSAVFSQLISYVASMTLLAMTTNVRLWGLHKSLVLSLLLVIPSWFTCWLILESLSSQIAPLPALLLTGAGSSVVFALSIWFVPFDPAKNLKSLFSSSRRADEH